MQQLHWFAWWPTLIVVVMATITDLRSRRVPNWLVLPFLLAGFVVSPWRYDWNVRGQGFGWHGLGQCLAGFALAVLIYGFLFWMGGMGAGDMKLCASIGAWIGPSQLFFALVITGLAGGIMALCWAVYAGFFKEMFASTGDLIFGWKRRGMIRDPEMVLDNPLKRKMPYAPAIAIGTLMSFFAY
jgi:prepilin peptidase CpaA